MTSKPLVAVVAGAVIAAALLAIAVTLAGGGSSQATTVADATGAAAQAYGLSSFPFWVAVDADGTVVDRRSGELTLAQITEMATLATADPPKLRQLWGL